MAADREQGSEAPTSASASAGSSAGAPAGARAGASAGAPAGSGLPELPIAPAHPLVALGVVGCCLLMVVSAYAGPSLLGLAVLFAGMVVAWGWAGLLALPSPPGTAVVLGVGTAAGVVASVGTRTEPFLRWMPAALAVSLLAAFAHQLGRRDGRPRLVESLAGTITAVAVVSSGSALVPLPYTLHGPDAVLVSLSAIALGSMVELAAGRDGGHGVRRLAPAVGVALGLCLSAVLARTAGLPVLTGVVLGGSCAGISALVRLVLSPLPTMSGSRSQLVSGAASVLACGIVVYLLARVLLG